MIAPGSIHRWSRERLEIDRSPSLTLSSVFGGVILAAYILSFFRVPATVFLKFIAFVPRSASLCEPLYTHICSARWQASCTEERRGQLGMIREGRRSRVDVKGAAATHSMIYRYRLNLPLTETDGQFNELREMLSRNHSSRLVPVPFICFFPGFTFSRFALPLRHHFPCVLASFCFVPASLESEDVFAPFSPPAATALALSRGQRLPRDPWLPLAAEDECRQAQQQRCAAALPALVSAHERRHFQPPRSEARLAR